MVFSKRSWESYQATFCASELSILFGWIRAGQSGSVVGLPGAGKSNLLGFLCHRPDVIAQIMQDRPFKLAIVQVDLNNLTGDDLATFYRVILRSLHEAGEQIGAVEESLTSRVEDLYHKIEEKTDPFLSQSALRDVLGCFARSGTRLVLVLDPFDSFCRTAPTQVLDNLRGLRDSFKTTLTYIISLRRQLAYVRDPAELGELYDLLDTHVCWVGPLASDDARYLISQVEEATGRSFSKSQQDRLIDLTGGYPALLQAATFWLAETQASSAVSEWESRLLAEPGIQNRLMDMWCALTGEEQAALSVLQVALSRTSPKEQQEHVRQAVDKYKVVLDRLHTKRLLVQADSGHRLFSLLFARFVAGRGGVNAGRIVRDVRTDRFLRGEAELADLSEQDRRLLRHFLDHPVLAHTLDDLIEAAWADYDRSGVTNQAVQQAIRHLRTHIELNPARPSYLVTEHGAGYRFFPEGAPQG